MRAGRPETNPQTYTDENGVEGSYWRVGNQLKVSPLRREDLGRINPPLGIVNTKLMEVCFYKNQKVWEVAGWAETIEIGDSPPSSLGRWFDASMVVGWTSFKDKNRIPGEWRRIGHYVEVKPTDYGQIEQILSPLEVDVQNEIPTYVAFGIKRWFVPAWITATINAHPMKDRSMEYTVKADGVRARFSVAGARISGVPSHYLSIERLDKKGMFWSVLDRIGVDLPDSDQSKEIGQLKARIEKLEKLLLDQMIKSVE